MLPNLCIICFLIIIVFTGAGGLGEAKFEPTFVFTNSPNEDVTLRFFDVCDQYVQADENGTINTRQSDDYAAMNYPQIAVEIENVSTISMRVLKISQHTKNDVIIIISAVT